MVESASKGLMIFVLFFFFVSKIFSQDFEESYGYEPAIKTFVHKKKEENFSQSERLSFKFSKKISSKLAIFQSIFHVIEKHYVNPLDMDKMFKSMTKGLFFLTDSYSHYVSQKEYEAFLKEQKGTFVGIGLEMITKNHFHIVVSPIADSPAEKMGIQTGDKLIKVDGVSVLELSLNSVMSMITGPTGTSVELVFLRDGLEKTFYLNRCFIKEKVMKDFCIIDSCIAYLKISSFKKGVSSKLFSIVQNLVKQNIKGLVIDVRNNAGGLLEEAIKTVSLFIKAKKLILTVDHKYRSQKYFSDEVHCVSELPLCLLINKGTASASEVVAGALQDYGRATIIGEKSFGKGSIQSLIPLPKKGGAICLTTHRYQLPHGRFVERRGIVPDLLISSPSIKDFFVISHRKKRKKHLLFIPILSKNIKDKQLLGALKDLIK